jgi:hypothetical protein
VEAEEEGVAAIHGQGSSDRWQNQKKKKKTGPQKKNQQAAKDKTGPTDLARQSSGLCFSYFSHFSQSEKAWKSERPCSLQGN